MSKAIYVQNARFNDGKRTNHIYGRRIDLIIASSGVELSTNEWKRKNIPIKPALRQQSKNLRMNKAILKSLLENPIDQDLHDEICTLGMDWTGTDFRI